MTETWARQGRADLIAKRGRALAARAAAEPGDRDAVRDLEHLLRVLALTPGRSFTEVLVQLCTAGPPSGEFLRLTASLLAEAQPPQVALSVLTGGIGGLAADHPLRILLLHELLLRGVDPEPARRAGTLPAATTGGWELLPDRLAPFESVPPLPSRGYSGSAWEGPDGPDDPVPVRTADRRDPAGFGLRERTPASVAGLCAAPDAGGWSSRMAQVFTAARPLARADLPGVAARLPAECLAGMAPSASFEGSFSTPGRMWTALFLIASNGGMYTSGVHGAAGRLAVWHTLAALVDCPPDLPPAEFAARLDACTWYRFSADSPWFFNEINDFGAVVLTPDGRRIAVLAATDTD